MDAIIEFRDLVAAQIKKTETDMHHLSCKLLETEEEGEIENIKQQMKEVYHLNQSLQKDYEMYDKKLNEINGRGC